VVTAAASRLGRRNQCRLRYSVAGGGGARCAPLSGSGKCWVFETRRYHRKRWHIPPLALGLAGVFHNPASITQIGVGFFCAG